MKDFQRNTNERLTHIESVISKMDEIDGMKMKQQELEQGLASMKESMDALNTIEELERLRNNNEELKEKIDNLERFSRDFNIRLLGVNEDEGEDCMDIILDYITSLGFESASMEVENVHRIGKNKPRPIIAKLYSRPFKRKLLQVAKSAEGKEKLNGVRFVEDFIASDFVIRKKALPFMQKAYEEGKKVRFTKGKLLIDGKVGRCCLNYIPMPTQLKMEYIFIFMIKLLCCLVRSAIEDNNLVLNVAKTKSLLFTSQRHKERDCKLSLIILGRKISCVTTFKYLGVVFDNFMTWKAHADYVCKKVACRVGILGRIRGFLTKEVSILVHNTLILPLFDYCDIAWSSLLQQDQDRLQRLQHRSARIITCCTRSSEAMNHLRWSSLSKRRSYHKVKLVFLCLNSLAPSYFLAFFIRFSNIHSYSTRQSSRLLLPRVKSNFGKNTFLFSGAKIFNELPTDIMKAEDTQTFCRRAKGFLLS